MRAVTMSHSRTELRELAHRYLASLGKAPDREIALASDFRATENGAEVAGGKGMLASSRGVAGTPGLFVDAQTGQAVAIGALRLDAGLQPFALRLLLMDNTVCEAEAIVSSIATGHFADVEKLLQPDVIYDTPVPPERGATREELRDIADRYWAALEESDGSLIDVNYRADRFANGKKITNNIELLASPDRAVHTIQTTLTATRSARPIVRERRYPVLDQELGLAVSIAMADFHPPAAKDGHKPGTFYILNAYKIVDREIRIMDVIHEFMPHGARSGWV